MFPLVIPIIIVELLASGIVGGIFGGIVGKITAEVLSAIIYSWQGKTIAVLGERGVGKTTLINFLKSGTLSVENKQTVGAKNIETTTYELKDLKLRFNTVDLPGSKDAYAEWNNILAKADFVLYLLRTDKLMAHDEKTEKRVKDDLQIISKWLNDPEINNGSRPKVYLIGTHSDLDDDFPKSNNDSCIGNFKDKFNALPLVKDLVIYAGGKNLVKVILGSMKTQSDTEQLVHQLLEQEGIKNG